MEKIYEFENGLKMVYVQNKAVRSISLGVFVKTGSVNENTENNGISHMIEHMLFKGTKTRNAFDIVNETDSIGAKINAFTSKHNTCYYTVSIDTNIEKCFEILADLYFNSTFPEEELKRERRVILEELSESLDTPDDVCLENLANSFYKNHALGKSILGTKKSINSITRDDLFEYKDKYYTADNTYISVVGNISFEVAKKHVENNFLSNFSKKVSVANTNGKAKTNSVFVSAKKDIEQAHVAIAFPGFSYTDDRIVALQLLSTIFGLEMSSRLFQKVREQLGLCYTIYAFPSFYFKEGNMIIYTATNPESVQDALKAIKSEIELLLEKGITDEELNKGKEQMKTSLVLGQEVTTNIMRAQGRNMIFAGKKYDIDEKIVKIDNLTKEDILECAKAVFVFDHSAISYVGGKDCGDLLKLFKEC